MRNDTQSGFKRVNINLEFTEKTMFEKMMRYTRHYKVYDNSNA